MATTFTEKLLINRGKRLAFLLRHDKEAFEAGLIDKNAGDKSLNYARNKVTVVNC
jgi:hypothetical protein